MTSEGRDYPIELGLCYMFLVGYLAARLMVFLRLPGAVGIILVGFAFSYFKFVQEGIFESKGILKDLAFFLVLINAGFEISLQDIKPHVLLVAWLPGLFEIMGLMMHSVIMFDYTVFEGTVLGVCLFALGDGLVIPKMTELGRTFPGHPLPRLVFTCAPLEVSMALVLFNILKGLSSPKIGSNTTVGITIVSNIFIVLATLIVGAVVGLGTAWLVSARSKAKVLGRHFFTGTTVEGYLIISAVALGLLGLGSRSEAGRAMISTGLTDDPVLLGDLLVIVVGACFAAITSHEMMHSLEVASGGVWVFGQLILFGILGMNLTTDVFAVLFPVLCLMLVGIGFRFVGTFIAIFATRGHRSCQPGCAHCLASNTRSVTYDSLFCFVSSLPRATVQGVLATQPLAMLLFSDSSNGEAVDEFISQAGRLYIFLLAIFGTIVLDLVGPGLLHKSEDVANLHTEARKKEQWLQSLGWRLRNKGRKSSADDSNLAPFDPLQQLEICHISKQDPDDEALDLYDSDASEYEESPRIG